MSNYQKNKENYLNFSHQKDELNIKEVGLFDKENLEMNNRNYILPNNQNYSSKNTRCDNETEDYNSRSKNYIHNNGVNNMGNNGVNNNTGNNDGDNTGNNAGNNDACNNGILNSHEISKKVQKASFENSMNELKDIVDKLQKGDIKLEDAVNMYKKGVELYNNCNEQLKEAKMLVQNIFNSSNSADKD